MNPGFFDEEVDAWVETVEPLDDVDRVGVSVRYDSDVHDAYQVSVSVEHGDRGQHVFVDEYDVAPEVIDSLYSRVVDAYRELFDDESDVSVVGGDSVTW